MSPIMSQCRSCRTIAARRARGPPGNARVRPGRVWRRAEVFAKAAGSIGAVAFSRTGDPMIGEFGDAQLLRKFGNVPDDLSGLQASVIVDRRLGKRAVRVVPTIVGIIAIPGRRRAPRRRATPAGRGGRRYRPPGGET